MARLEKKSVTCKPYEENDTIHKFEKFGWTLESSQEVYNKDSHIEGRFDGNYSVTETTNYVKLLFSRDKDMPYYDKITELETKFDSIVTEEPSKAGKTASSCFAALYGWPLAILGLILSIGLKEPVFLLMAGIGAAVLFLRFRSHKSYKDAQSEATAECMKKRADILAEVEKYV